MPSSSPKVAPISRESQVSQEDVSRKKKDDVSKEEKKQAKGQLYGCLFRNCMAKVAIFPSIVCGAIPILFYLVFGEMVNVLADLKTSVDDKANKMLWYLLYYCCIAVGAAIFRFLDQFLWLRLGSKVSVELRASLFRSMMRAEVTFFDVNSIGGILTLLAEDSALVQDAFGTTKGQQLQNLAQFLTGIILAFVYSWRQALVALVAIPVIVISIGMFMPKIAKLSMSKFEHTAASITIAEETIGAIRTVKTFTRELIETERFKKEALLATKDEVKISVLMTIMMSIMMLILWGDLIADLYYGGILVVDRKLAVGDVFSVFGFTMFGCMGILMMQGSMQAEQKAIVAGARILKLTNHVPAIPFEGGDSPDHFSGDIEFRNVSFKYPTRDVYVLKNVSFRVNPGEIAALVGHSGSGKSTCVQLIERFYDVEEGVILLDGVDIRSYDPRWLHRRIGLVSQEPVLFHLTIKENILYGVEASSVSEEQVIEAATTANAAKFIKNMPKGYDTMVGEKGSSLSGGQKQRIAIARAVIKDPTILVTDEATSALDAESEKKVQVALDKVMDGRTAVIVAHRLSTIRNAKVIYVFEAGEIKEQGTHDDLVNKGGYYFNLVQRQLKDPGSKEKEKKSAKEGRENEEPPKKKLKVKPVKVKKVKNVQQAKKDESDSYYSDEGTDKPTDNDKSKKVAPKELSSTASSESSPNKPVDESSS